MERDDDGGMWMACKMNATKEERFVSSRRFRFGRRNASSDDEFLFLTRQAPRVLSKMRV